MKDPRSWSTASRIGNPIVVGDAKPQRNWKPRRNPRWIAAFYAR